MFKKPEFSMQNAKPQTKNSTISRGTCCHGLLDKCRKYSTKRPIFLQNKANLQKSQMDISLNITRNYEKNLNWTLGENKPNQSQSTDPVNGANLDLMFTIYYCSFIFILQSRLRRTRHKVWLIL
jgi:hypothetical protein